MRSEYPLHTACAECMSTSRFIRVLEKHKHRVNDTDNAGPSGCTPILLCLQLGRHDFIRSLLDAGANVDASEPSELRFTLHYATRYRWKITGSKCADILEELIDAGAINQLNTCDKDGRTPLHLACVYKPFESDAIDVLLQAGARTDVWDSKGRTPLMYACYNFPIRVEYVRSLLNAGADVRARSPQGDTALSLFLAGRTSETEDDAVVATLLCNAGAEVDTVDALGRTPLHGLCRRGTAPGLARLLLERKASVASRDARGATPLLEACASGSVDTVLLLMESGADLLAEDADGVTALMRLAELRLDRGEKPLRRFVAGLVEVIERMHD